MLFIFIFPPIPFIYIGRNIIFYISEKPFFISVYIFRKLSSHDIRLLCIINYNDYNFGTFFNCCFQNNLLEIGCRNGNSSCLFLYGELKNSGQNKKKKITNACFIRFSVFGAEIILLCKPLLVYDKNFYSPIIIANRNVFNEKHMYFPKNRFKK